MKTRSWLLLLGFSIAGYAAMFLLFPKLTPAAKWGHKLDRQAAIIQAKEIARSLSVEKIESDDWIATVQISYDTKTEYYLSQKQTGLGQGLFTPLRTSVLLFDPGTSRKVKVEMNSEGKLVAFDISSPKSKTAGKESKGKDGQDGDDQKGSAIKVSTSSQRGQPSSDNQPAASGTVADSAKAVSEADKLIAESAFKSFWGEKLSAIASLTESASTQQGARLIWSASEEVLKLTVRALVNEGKVTALSLEREFTPEFNKAF
ncbi:MAG: hypothetical protein ABI977_16155, partial [Acidobacteriota bacterium]